MVDPKLTIIGRKKLCRAHCGVESLPPIAYMAFGTGGTDEEGNPLPVSGIESGLNTEVLRKEIGSHEFTSDTACRYSARLDKTELINQSITEMGLLDSAGDLIIYETFRPKVKDEGLEITFNMSEDFMGGV